MAHGYLKCCYGLEPNIMNHTNWEHAGFALLMQIAIALPTGNWWAGAAFGIAFFLGREHAQFQHKLGYTLKDAFKAFDMRKWCLDAKLDFLFPLTACVLLALVMTRL